MTYNEFILYRQEHYYFAKDNGLPIYSKDDLNSDSYEQNNEYMYNSLELQSYTSNIKTHQLEIKFTNLKFKDMEYDTMLQNEYDLHKILVNISNHILFDSICLQFNDNFKNKLKNATNRFTLLKEFKDCLFDSVLNKYLDSDGNSDKLNEFLENILLNKYTSEDYKQMLMDVIV